MHVPEIIEVKEHLDNLKKENLIEAWELPYENLLTRRSAAIFFVAFSQDDNQQKVWDELARYEDFSFRKNDEKKLSQLDYRITYSAEEKEKNDAAKSD